MNITLSKTQIKELNIKILKLFFPASAFRFVDWSIAYGPESSGCWPTESNGKIYYVLNGDTYATLLHTKLVNPMHCSFVGPSNCFLLFFIIIKNKINV